MGFIFERCRILATLHRGTTAILNGSGDLDLIRDIIKGRGGNDQVKRHFR